MAGGGETDAGASRGPTLRRQVTIVNQRGLHARAAAKFVKLAASFEADIQVGRNGAVVSGASIMGLMMLAAAPGAEIELIADGAQAEPALAALAALVANRFDED